MPVYIPLPITMPPQVVSRGREVLTEMKVREILARNDRNGDGCLTMDELTTALKEIGSRWPCYRAHRLLPIADVDHDGRICGKHEMDKLVASILNWYYAQ